ncbi:MAG: hypothetical protein Q9195_001535 [Heterodermia aff. obscurata]
METNQVMGTSPGQAEQTATAFTVESVYADARAQIERMRASAGVSAKYYDILLHTTSPDDIVSNGDRTSSLQSDSGRFDKVVGSTVTRIHRYADAIDMIAQSSPQAYGLNIAGLIWGSFKFLLVIAKDISATYDTVVLTLEHVRQSLPSLGALARIYGDSELRLLYRPLVDIYAAIISLGIKTAEHLSRGIHSLKTVAHSAWSSLQADFEPSLAKIADAGQRIEQAASVEHMYATDVIGKNQGSEILKQDHFRTEVRRHMRETRKGDTYNVNISPFNDAPMGLLSQTFTGRKKELNHLDIFINSQRNDGKPARYAVVGMPGLGKTQLALKTASNYFGQSKTRVVFWVSAATPQRFSQGYSKILELIDHIDRDHSDQSVKLVAAQRWLEHDVASTCQLNHGDFKSVATSNTHLSWLLIFDSISEETVPILRRYLPRSNGHGVILLTTRHIDVAKALVQAECEGQHILTLELPQRDDAIRLLCTELEQLEGNDSSTDQKSDTSKAGELVQSLGRLPFAISQVASFANQCSKDINYMLRLCQGEYKLQMLSWDNRLARYEQGSVMAMFETKLEDLNEKDPLTGMLLKILSLMDPESIPVDIWATEAGISEPSNYDPRWVIRNTYGHKDPNNEGELGSDNEAQQPPNNFEASDSSNTAPRKRFMGRIRAKFGRRKEMSVPIKNLSAPEVAHVDYTSLRSSTSDSWTDCWTEQMTGLLNDPVKLPLALQKLQKLTLVDMVDNGKAARMHDLVQLMVRQDMERIDATDSCFGVAALTVQQSLFLSGNPRTPKSWSGYERLLPHIHSLINFHQSMSWCSYNMVCASRMMSTYLRFRGQANESIKLLSKIIKLQESRHDPKDLDLIRNLSELAATYNYDGDYDSALPLVIRVVACRKEQLGEQHPHYLNALVSLASIKRSQENFEEAEALIQEALRGYDKLPDERDFKRSLAVQNDLGLVYAAQGQHEEAIRVYEKTMSEVEKSLDPDDATSVTLMANLADAYTEVGQQHEAQRLYERALQIREDVWGMEHPATLEVMENLAGVYEIQAMWDKAEMIRDAILILIKNQCGDGHPKTLAAMRDLAHAYQYQERYDDCIHLQKSVVDGARSRFGADHERTWRERYNLAIYYMGSGKLHEAQTMFDEVLLARKRLLGEDHDDTFDSYMALGELRYKQNRLEEAHELLDLALSGQSNSSSRREFTLSATRRILADICSELGKDERAEELYKSALVGTERIFGWPNTQTVYVMRQLGIFYLDRQRWAEAEPLERRAVEGREAIEGPNHDWTDSAICGLAQALEGLGRYKEAESLRRRVLKIRTEREKPDVELLVRAKSLLVHNLYLQGDNKEEGIKLHYEILEDEEDYHGLRHPDTDKTRRRLWYHLMQKRKLYLDDLSMCTLVLESSAEDLGVNHWHTKLALQTVLGMLHHLGTVEHEEDRMEELNSLVEQYSKLGVDIGTRGESRRPTVSFDHRASSTSGFTPEENPLQSDETAQSYNEKSAMEDDKHVKGSSGKDESWGPDEDIKSGNKSTDLIEDAWDSSEENEIFHDAESSSPPL